MPEVEVTLLAATLFDKTRCCIAGLDSGGKWIRPGFPGAELGTRPGTCLVLPNHLWSSSGFIGGSLSVLSMSLEAQERLVPPHIEDARMLSLPRFVRSITREKDRLRFLESHTENGAVPPATDERDLAEGLGATGRSLVLVGPLRLAGASFGNLPGMYGGEKFRTRLEFKLPRQRTMVDLPCTDLSWRALGRALGATDEVVALDGEDLCRRLGVRPDVYLSLGLTRGLPYAMVVGVHTVPAFVAVRTEEGLVQIKVRQNLL